MARKKVSLTYIQNSSKRRTTFRKRKEGIQKKVVEISTLCDIEACLVLYSEFDAQPLVWPSVDEVRRRIMKFQSSSSNVDQQKRMVNQETLTMERIQKIEYKLRKLHGDNRLKEIMQIMFGAIVDSQTTLSRLDMEDCEELARVTNQNLSKVQRMIEIHQREDSSFNPPQGLVSMPNMAFPPPLPPVMTSSFLSMSFPTANMEFSFGAGNSGVVDGDQQLALRNEFMSLNYHDMFQPFNPGFSMTSQMFPPPPIMPFSPQSMSFPAVNMRVFPLPTDSPLNDVTYMDPNMAMVSYPSNQSNNADMGPQDPSTH